MGGTWCMLTSLLIMFGKFEKIFGWHDNEEKKLLANVFRTSRRWWTLPLLPRTYCHIGCDLFLTSLDYWWHKASDVSSCLRSTGIIARRRKMGHVHATCIDQDAKRLRNLFVILLLFYSPLNLKVLCERYRDDMSHDMQHRSITNGGTAKDAYNDTLLLLKAKLMLTNKGLHDFSKMSLALPFVEMLHVNLQLAMKFDYDKDVFHGYINQNLPRFNICQEKVVIAVFNVVAQGEGAVFFLDNPSGLSKTFVYNVLLAWVRQDWHIAIGVASFGIAALVLESGQTSHLVFKIPIAIGRDSYA